MRIRYVPLLLHTSSGFVFDILEKPERSRVHGIPDIIIDDISSRSRCRQEGGSIGHVQRFELKSCRDCCHERVSSHVERFQENIEPTEQEIGHIFHIDAASTISFTNTARAQFSEHVRVPRRCPHWSLSLQA